jgi:hypothetical protein
MENKEVIGLLERVIDGVNEIDRECRTRRKGIEHGLVNVKLEFQDQVLRETNKKLTEEQLIAWLVRQKLVAWRRDADWEVRYPGNGRLNRCDLATRLSGSSRLWLELKLAWKAWFNCVGAPTYSNRAYASYLDGRDRSHSLRHDFEKLLDADFAADDRRAVCLIGFDCAKTPMDKDVAAVVRRAQKRAPWELAAERHWLDRRSCSFRINVWIWLLQAPREELPRGREAWAPPGRRSN